MGGGGGGEIRDLVVERDFADFAGILDGLGAFGRVQNQCNLAVFHDVGNVRAALVDLVHHRGGDAVFLEKLGGATGGDDFKTEIGEGLDRFDHLGLFVIVFDGYEHFAA